MLDLDWKTILFEMVNFLVLAVVLYYLVFKPIVKRSEKVAAEKAALIEAIRRDRREAAEKLAQVNTRIENFEQELQTIADEVYSENRSLQDDLLDATRAEANQIIENAVIDARKSYLVDQMQEQLNLADTVLHISAESIRKVLPASVHNEMITQLTSKVWNLGKTDMRRVELIRESLAGRTSTVRVESAHPLTMEQKGLLVRTFGALADEDIVLNITVNEALIAGIRVFLGDQIIENTIQSELEEIREDVKESLDKLILEDDIDNNAQ